MAEFGQKLAPAAICGQRDIKHSLRLRPSGTSCAFNSSWRRLHVPDGASSKNGVLVMPRKRTTTRRRSNITYLSPRRTMSNTTFDSNSSAAGGGRTAPPSRIGRIYFERDSAVPRSEDIAVLRRHARYLLLNSRAMLTIRGYSNRRRQDDGARRLARTRAAIIRILLLTMGVKKRQLDTEVGDIYRVTAATTRKSRAKNRRAELNSHSWDVGVSMMPSFLQIRRPKPRLQQRA